MYVGMSFNIPKRIFQHKQTFKKTPTHTYYNKYLLEDVATYGMDNFEFIILKLFENITKHNLLIEEAKWIKNYRATNREYGYNLDLLENGKMILQPETIEKKRKFKTEWCKEHTFNHTEKGRKIMSEAAKNRWAKGSAPKQFIEKMKSIGSKNWESEEYRRKWSMSQRKDKYVQYSSDMKTIIKIYECTYDITRENPTFNMASIAQAARMRAKGKNFLHGGFAWKRIPLTKEDVCQNL